jgi:hypothetical protein
MSEEPEVISMVQCPYCDKEWVREDLELVCKECEPRMYMDLCIADMAQAVDTIKESKIKDVKDRYDLLLSIHQSLGKILKSIKEK